MFDVPNGLRLHIFHSASKFKHNKYVTINKLIMVLTRANDFEIVCVNVFYLAILLFSTSPFHSLFAIRFDLKHQHSTSTAHYSNIKKTEIRNKNLKIARIVFVHTINLDLYVLLCSPVDSRNVKTTHSIRAQPEYYCTP